MTIDGSSNRANFYIDGFNLYHGCFDDLQNRPHWRQYRWLDLNALCSHFCAPCVMHQIRYFTARVAPKSGNPENRTRQDFYLRAVATIPHLTIHEGRFATNRKRRPLADLQVSRPQETQPVVLAEVIEREEKGSDVNLASYLLLDACKGDCERAVVISNDSDLAEPIRLVQREFGIDVMILNPRKFIARDLRGIAAEYSNIKFRMLQNSQFPETLADAAGPFTKPAHWS
jgi:uncharacterized LabA/DUF88 family protein